ncbi:MAG: hypothetical protein JSS46_00060 [Proteobacteria bacterium]|nr:hypothetical protein [Pseudomonadota bacterium]
MLAEVVVKLRHPVVRGVEAMEIVGAIALAASLACVSLLYGYRSDNLNVRSTWLCSRNDVIANLGVLAAAGAGSMLASRWPDIVVGVVIAGVFLRSAAAVLIDGSRAFRLAGSTR